MKTYSLYGKSFQALFIPIILAVLVTLGLSFNASRIAVARMSDEQMQQLAGTLFVLTRHEAVEGEDIRQTLGSHNELWQTLRDSQMAFRIWGKGHIITQSSNADQMGPRIEMDGFHNTVAHAHNWRIYSLRNTSRDIQVEIAQDQDLRGHLILKIISSLFLPLVFLLPTVLLIIRFNLSKAIKPLLVLSSDVAKRDANNLTPFYIQQVPKEVLPIFTALNDLISRIDSSLTREREFTDNAAHELRTPLAALKTRAQVLKKQLKNPKVAAESLDELLLIIDRNVKLVDQLLSFARIQSAEMGFVVFNFSALIEGLFLDIATPEVIKHQSIQMRVEPNVCILGDVHAIRVLVSNLLQNAINYNDEFGQIEITLSATASDVILTIKDTGVGIPDSKKDEVFERFKRLDSRKLGNGLGLSIVKWVANQHNAKLKLADNVPQGLIVTVEFKRAQSTQ